MSTSRECVAISGLTETLKKQISGTPPRTIWIADEQPLTDSTIQLLKSINARIISNRFRSDPGRSRSWNYSRIYRLQPASVYYIKNPER